MNDRQNCGGIVNESEVKGLAKEPVETILVLVLAVSASVSI